MNDCTTDDPLQACIDWLRNRRPQLYAFACVQAGSDLDAEELLSETVKNIARALADKRLPGDPEAMTPYAFTCMRNTASNWRKRRVRRQISEKAYGEETPRRIDSRPWLHMPEDADCLQRLLARHVQNLPAVQAEVVVMKIWSGLTTTQIARITGKPKSTVDSRYHTALDKLRLKIGADPSLSSLLP